VQRLAAAGPSLNNAADRTLLRSRIDSPLAKQGGFNLPYLTCPGSQTVAKSLRPFPQFDGNPQRLWSPLGDSWYDSLHQIPEDPGDRFVPAGGDIRGL
jgi:hypothetical protein